MKVKPGCRTHAASGHYHDLKLEDFDDSDVEDQRERNHEHKERSARKAAPVHNKGTNRTRPTNNQLLYKAYFRWQHFGKCKSSLLQQLPFETDACASVTAAFLQVLSTLQKAENLTSESNRRNILQILSNNTRRTKVVELSTGTHRVPEELRKHYLTDGQGGQYSTNLDRNRYGNDDQYLFTVIRYDLEYLGFCGCLVDVEIIDAKANSQAILVSTGPESCTCCKDTPEEPQAAKERSQPRPTGAGDSPKRSASARSDLFDALVTVATGGTDPEDNLQKPSSKSAKLPAAAKRWSTALSWDGEQDSLQVALDAFKKMEFGATSAQSLSLLNFSISKMGLPGPSSGLGGVEDDVASDLCQPPASERSGDLSLRKRSRKPVRRSNSLLVGEASNPAPTQLPPIGVHEASDENAKDEVEQPQQIPTPVVDNDSDGLNKVVDNADAGENDLGAENDTDSPQKPAVPGTAPQRRRLHYVARQSSAINLGTRLSPAELKRLAAEVQCLRDENSKLTDQLREESNLTGAAQLRKDLDMERGKVRDLETQMAQLRQDLQLLVSAKQAEEEKNKSLAVELTSTKSLLDGLAKAFANSGGLFGMAGVNNLNNLLGANAAAAAAAAALSQLNSSTLSSQGLMDPLGVPSSLPASLGTMFGNNLFGASMPSSTSLLGSAAASAGTGGTGAFPQASTNPNSLSLSMLNDPTALLKNALGTGLPSTLASLAMLPSSNLPMFQQAQPSGADGVVPPGVNCSQALQNLGLPLAAMSGLTGNAQSLSGLQSLMGMSGLQQNNLSMAQLASAAVPTTRPSSHAAKRSSEDAGLPLDQQHAEKRIAWDMPAGSLPDGAGSTMQAAAGGLMSMPGSGPQLVKVEQ